MRSHDLPRRACVFAHHAFDCVTAERLYLVVRTPRSSATCLRPFHRNYVSTARQWSAHWSAQYAPHLGGIRPSFSVPQSVCLGAVNAIKAAEQTRGKSTPRGSLQELNYQETDDPKPPLATSKASCIIKPKLDQSLHASSGPCVPNYLTTDSMS